MDLSKLSPAPGSRHRKKRLGRGEASGKGKTSGKGGKGQTARTGGKIPARFEGGQMPLYRRVPKLGFVSKARTAGLNSYNIINLSILERFPAGSKVDAEAIRSIGFGKSAANKAGIKVLGSGKLTKKLNVKVQAISSSAKEKIESLGGTVELV